MKILLYLVIHVLKSSIIIGTGEPGNFTYPEETENVWIEYDNTILQKITENHLKYGLEEINIEESLMSVINENLNPFKEKGITKQMIMQASSYGNVYHLINHVLYRSKECMFPSRCEGVEHFLLKFTNSSDYEIVINMKDYPQMFKAYSPKLPVFSFSKTNEHFDIMYPAWSFWSGGPAIKLHPTGIGRWDKLRKSIIKEKQKWPWQEKLDTAFFRGSRTSDERDELVYLSREYPDLVDAAFTKNQAWKSVTDTLNMEPVEEVSFEGHCKYKYLFNFRGVAASFRFKHLFLCKSLVFHVGDEWEEFFYPVMKPWVHYVPIKSDYKRDDLRKILLFFRTHDNIAQKIAENGYLFVKKYLKLSNVSWYWKTLLNEYVQIQKFKPTINPTSVRVS